MILKDGMCTTNGMMVRYVPRDLGRGRGYGWSTRNVTKLICKARKSFLTVPDISSRGGDNSDYVFTNNGMEGKVTFGGKISHVGISK